MPPKKTSDLARAQAFAQVLADATRMPTLLFRVEGEWKYVAAGWPCAGTYMGVWTPAARGVERREEVRA